MTRRHATIDVTVMICTWNNGVQLDLTLATLGRCRIPTGFTWEVVVVNNDSSEATDRVVARHRHTLPLVLEHEPLTGLSRARNRGLQVARGNLIVFTDDDVTVSEGWLEAYWEAYAARPDCFLGGRIRSQFGGQPPDPRVLRFAPPSVKGLDYGPDRRLLEPGEYFIGPNWACPALPPQQGRGLRRVERVGRQLQARARGRRNQSHEALAGRRRQRPLSARGDARPPRAAGEEHADTRRAARGGHCVTTRR